MKEPSEIKNKIKRQEIFAKQQHAKNMAKHKARMRRKKIESSDAQLKEERISTNVPRTIESMREFDDTLVQMGDREVMEDEAGDEFASYFKDGQVPKVLVTTCTHPTRISYEFCDELTSIFPYSEFVKRPKNCEIKDIVRMSKERQYTDIIVVNEDKKTPNALTFIHLPDGPTTYFKLTNFVAAKEVYNHARQTPHDPELLLNNFSTRLGHTVGRMFASMFPHRPQFEGRQVVTFHNQRDFIFFRRHRYKFRNEEKASLQEIGPRFTLKLQWLQRGAFEGQHGEYEWKRTSEMEKESKKKFFL